MLGIGCRLELDAKYCSMFYPESERNNEES